MYCDFGGKIFKLLNNCWQESLFLAFVIILIILFCLTFRAQIKRMQIVQHVARVWMIVLDIMATLILNYLYFMLVIFVQLSQCCKQYVRYAETKDIEGCIDNIWKLNIGGKACDIYILMFNCQSSENKKLQSFGLHIEQT